MAPELIIATITDWMRAEPAIQAMAIVGSHARRDARAESDIDLVLLATNPQMFRTSTSWLHAIGWARIGVRPLKWRDEDYGALWSRRVWLEDNAGEIEFGFALPEWAELHPLDPGTRRVVPNGCRILHDPMNILAALLAAVGRG
jgi:hypothetical protein